MALLIGDVLRHAARVVPTRLAATMGQEELTFGELDAGSNRLARALAAAGVAPGDRVAWWGETGLPAMPIFGALAKLGAAFMPVNARLGVDETAEILGYARPTATIVDEAHEGAPFESVAQAALFAEAAGQPSSDVDPLLDERDTHVVFFTSGSTGRPKGVVLSHRASYLRSFPNLITDWSGATVCMFPLFHMSGWSMTLNAWQMRLPVHLAPPDAAALLETAQRRRATRLYCLPAVWGRVLEHDRGRYDLSSVRECDTGTSATPPELLHAIKDSVPGHGHAHLLRVDRGRTGHPAGRRRPGTQARFGRPPRTGRRPSPHRRGRGVRPQRVPHGRVLRGARGHRGGAA